MEIAGKYRMLRLIGTGATGAVYESEHLLTGRRVAVKVLHPFFSEVSARRFLREAKAAARIQHRAVVEIFDAGESEGQRYLVFELLSGTTLAMHLEERSLRQRELIETMAEVLDVLQIAHSQGVIHRDVKPENIFVSKTDRGLQVKLLDFGIVRDLMDPDNLTIAGTLLGTPEYMSPEQATGVQATERSDLWSVGAVLFHGLAGRPPFEAETRVGVLEKIVLEDPAKLPGDVPPALTEVVMRALAKSPQDRFASAAEMRAELLACDRPRMVKRGVIALVVLAAALLALSPLLAEEAEAPKPAIIVPAAEVLPRVLEIRPSSPEEPLPKPEVSKPRRVRIKKAPKKPAKIDLIREYR